MVSKAERRPRKPTKLDEQSKAAESTPEGRPQGTRRAYRSADERKQQILRAAQEAFSRASLHGVSTRDIARAADINPATLFEHFGTKEALFREAVIAPLFTELAKLKTRVDVYQTASQDVSLEIALAGVQRQISTMTRLFPLFTSALFSDLELGQKLYREHVIPLIEERVRLTLGLATPGTDPYFLELAAVGMLFFIAMDARFGDGRLDPNLAAKQLVRFIAFGSAPRPDEVHHSVSTSGKTPLRQLRRLGRSQLFVSPLGLTFSGSTGAPLAPEQVRPLLERYRTQGGNFVETAASPGADAIDRVLAQCLDEEQGGLLIAHRVRVGRSQAEGQTGPAGISRAVAEYVEGLGLKRLDLLVIDAPYGTGLAELAEACADLAERGTIRHAAFGQVPAWQAARIHTLAARHGNSPFIALREPFDTAEQVLPMAAELGLGVIAAPSAIEHADGVAQQCKLISRELGCTPAQVLMAWQTRAAGVTTMLSAPTNAAELDESVAALDLALAPEHLERLEKSQRN